jgi:hypothetical protein
MGANASKLKCLYLPAQSGKTRKVEELIEGYTLVASGFGDGDINIIISANNILLVEQTKTRMVTDLATPKKGASDAVIRGGVFSWTCGTKASNISPTDLAFNLLSEVEMVVLCAHPVRMKYLYTTLQRLSACPLFTKKINIWIDEADKSIHLWQKYDKDVLSLPAVNQVTLVSATFDSVFKKYKNLQVMGFSVTHPECYRCLKDAVKIADDYASERAYDYVRHVMLKYRAELVRPGLRAFIPGEMTKDSHDLIADFLHKELNFVVIIINGIRKEILVPGGGVIDLRHYLTMSNDDLPEELSSQLSKLYKDNRWERFPLAITGYLCVQRGVTFQCGPKEDVHDGFLFDYGVIPPIANKADAYQVTSRLFGNIGHLPSYKPVHIYTTSRMIEIVKKQESIAVNLARMVEEQGIEVVGKDYLKMVANYNTNVEVREYDSIEDLKREWFEISKKTARCPNKNDENQYVCAIGEKSSKQKADDVRKFITGTAAGWGSGLTDAQTAKKRGEEVGPIHRVYVGYTDEDKPKFFLRWMNV